MIKPFALSKNIGRFPAESLIVELREKNRVMRKMDSFVKRFSKNRKNNRAFESGCNITIPANGMRDHRYQILSRANALFDVEINLARAASHTPASLYLDGDLAAFGQCPEKIGGLLRACNGRVVYLGNHVAIAQTHLR